MASQDNNFWNSPATPQGGGFWDTAPVAKTPVSNQLASIGIDEHKKKLANAQFETAQYQAQSDQANSFWGMAKNFGEGVLSGLANDFGKPIFKAAAILGTKAGKKDINASYTPQNQFQADLVGGNEPINFTTQGNSVGIKNKTAAPLVGGVLTALDATPFGGEEKSAAKAVTLTEDTTKYLKTLTQSQEAARTAGGPVGLIEKGKALLASTKAKYIDLASPIEDTLSQAVKKSKITLTPEEQIGPQIDRVFRAPSLANQFMEDQGFKSVIKAVDNPDHFDQYLIAKQAIDADTRGITTGRNLEKDAQLIRELAPKYEAQAQQVYQYSRALLDKAVGDGLIGADLAQTLRQRYPNYVPLQRIFSAVEEVAGQGSNAIASNSSQSVIRKLVGSERDIESPIKSIYQKTLDVFSQGERNRAGQILASYEKLPGNPFQLTEINRAVNPGEHTISFLDNGVKRTFTTTPEIANAAKALNAQQLGTVLKAISLPVRIARLGITSLNPAFVAANLARDQVTAFINSRHALSVFNPVNFTRALFEAVGHGNLYDEAVRSGALGTSYDLTRSAAAASIDKIRSERSAAAFAWHTLRHPSDLVSTIENLFGRSEELTRLQVYSGTKKALMAKGVAEDTARLQAAQAARQGTVDFARRGEYGSVLNSIWLYMNANIQGTRTLLRTLQERPVETMAKITIAGIVPVVTTTLYNLSDPERKKIYEDIPQYEKDNNLIFIGPNAEKNPETGRYDGVYKIPLSQEIRSLLEIPRRIVEAAHDLDPVRASEIAQSLIGTVEPFGTTPREIGSFAVPQAIKPAVQAWAGEDLFSGAPTVPKKLEGLPADMQVKPDTSTAARYIGGKLDASPLKVEKFAKDTLGSLGEIAFGKNPVTKVGERFTSAAGGQQENQDFMELNSIITQQKGNSHAEKQKAEQTFEELRTIANEKGEPAAQEVFNQIVKQNPQLAEDIVQVLKDEKLGLTGLEKTVKQLGVDNGERAKYIWKKMNELETKGERDAYLKNLVDKKIATKAVLEQLRAIRNKTQE